MQDYEKKVSNMLTRTEFYLKTLNDMNIDSEVDKLIVEARKEIRDKLNYRIQWPEFNTIALTADSGPYVSGKGFDYTPLITYNFQMHKVPDEFYLRFLELSGNEIDAQHVYKTFSYQLKINNRRAVEIEWKLYCDISEDDKDLLRSMGVMKREKSRMVEIGGGESISCDLPDSDIPF